MMAPTRWVVAGQAGPWAAAAVVASAAAAVAASAACISDSDENARTRSCGRGRCGARAWRRERRTCRDIARVAAAGGRETLCAADTGDAARGGGRKCRSSGASERKCCVQSAAPLQQQRWPQVLHAVSAQAGAARLGRLGAARADPRARAAGAAPTGWRGTVTGMHTSIELGQKRSNSERRALQVRRLRGAAGAAPMPGQPRGRGEGGCRLLPRAPGAARAARRSVP